MGRAALNRLLAPAGLARLIVARTRDRRHPTAPFQPMDRALGQLVPQPQRKQPEEETQHAGDKEWNSARLDVVAR